MPVPYSRPVEKEAASGGGALGAGIHIEPDAVLHGGRAGGALRRCARAPPRLPSPFWKFKRKPHAPRLSSLSRIRFDSSTDFLTSPTPPLGEAHDLQFRTHDAACAAVACDSRRHHGGTGTGKAGARR